MHFDFITWRFHAAKKKGNPVNTNLRFEIKIPIGIFDLMRNREETMGIILHQAGGLFNSHGYKATSIGHITDASGFTKGAIYRHFKSKEKLEEEALGYLTGIMFENLTKRIKAQNNAGDKLRAIVNFFESYISKPPIKGGCPLLNAAVEADDSSRNCEKKPILFWRF